MRPAVSTGDSGVTSGALATGAVLVRPLLPAGAFTVFALTVPSAAVVVTTVEPSVALTVATVDPSGLATTVDPSAWTTGALPRARLTARSTSAADLAEGSVAMAVNKSVKAVLCSGV